MGCDVAVVGRVWADATNAAGSYGSALVVLNQLLTSESRAVRSRLGAKLIRPQREGALIYRARWIWTYGRLMSI
jgi:hypothetical protein